MKEPIFDKDELTQSFTMEGVTKRTDIPVRESKSKVNSSNKFIMVLDCDEVLVNISYKWFKKIKAHPVLSQYVPEKCLRPEFRDKYYLNDWLNIPEEHMDEFLSIYYDDEEFYDDLEPSFLMRSIMSSLDYIEGIHILTNCGSKLDMPVNKSKIKWLRKHFKSAFTGNNLKIDFQIHTITSSYKGGKGAFLANNQIPFNSIAEDHLENIYDILNSVDYINNFEVIMPLYGYNCKFDPSEVTNGIGYKLQPVHNLDDMNQEDFSTYIKELYFSDTDTEE